MKAIKVKRVWAYVRGNQSLFSLNTDYNVLFYFIQCGTPKYINSV